MTDGKYLSFLGISLTAFLGSGFFLMMLWNPKNPAYSLMPAAYAVACFVVGLLTGYVAKRAGQTHNHTTPS